MGRNAQHHRRLTGNDRSKAIGALSRFLMRRGGREGRRLRRAAVSLGDAPKKNRPCAAEGAAFQGHHPGEPSLGRRGRGGRCDLRCAQGCAGAGGRGRKARGTGLRGRDRRTELLRRPAAAAHDRARTGEKAGSPDSGRQRVGARFRDGCGAAARAQRKLPWKPAVVIISQRTASIRFADEILVLDDGRLAGRGTHDELLQTCEVYREIYESQFKKEDAR